MDNTQLAHELSLAYAQAGYLHRLNTEPDYEKIAPLERASYLQGLYSEALTNMERILSVD